MEIFQDSSVWIVCSFAVFLYVLMRFARPAVLGALDRRIEAIKREIETAESLRVEAQELLAQYQRRQRDAADEAAQIVATAHAHVAEIEKQAEKDLAETAARREQQLAERLARMEDNARREIQAYAAELAIKATTEIIAAQMDKKTNENLVEKSIKDLSRKLA